MSHYYCSEHGDNADPHCTACDAAREWIDKDERIAALEQQLAEFKQTARRLVTDTHDKWAIDRLIILAGEQ